MLKATIIGHFGYGLEYFDGQTVKTKKVKNELIRCFGDNCIRTIDTHGGIKTLLRAPVDILTSAFKSENVIILPAQNGLKVYAPLLKIVHKMAHTRIHYVVIGGWLADEIKKNEILKKSMKCFEGIYVETKTMEKELRKLGFHNVFILPNFKEFQDYPASKMKFSKPYPLCTFSRVMKEKGIEDAIEAVNRINKICNSEVYKLDIYGPVAEEQKEWFDNLKNQFGKSVEYKGIVQTDNSTNIIHNYYALLLPTHYYTEGIPGTIIDSYAAGVPVVCSKWESFSDVVVEGKTGIGYAFDSSDGLFDVLYKASEKPEYLYGMRGNCSEFFQQFTPRIAMQELIIRM